MIHRCRPLTRDGDLALPALRERGWTPALVRAFLGEPDKLAPNPAYRSAAPMRLYRRERVEEAEASDGFREAQAKATRRSEAAAAVADGKRRELLAEIETTPVRVEVMDCRDLRREAIGAYNRRGSPRERWGGWDDGWRPAREDGDPLFLERITVNFVRHKLTRYDRELERVAGKVGVAEAVTAIQRRVYEAVMDAYPCLVDECRRQAARKGIDLPLPASDPRQASLPLDAAGPQAP